MLMNFCLQCIEGSIGLDHVGSIGLSHVGSIGLSHEGLWEPIMRYKHAPNMIQSNSSPHSQLKFVDFYTVRKVLVEFADCTSRWLMTQLLSSMWRKV